MIRLVPEKGITRVAAFCDQCGLEITNGKGAMYTWDPNEDLPQPVFLHKGSCDQSFGKKGEWPWEEMSRFPIYLGR